ncbi:conserved hypothetical protein [Bosea sp. 62]|uniref:hypothetical protein n=1 Tax=unclassified Bosea (in: a-proteobacteria) TaxID=2653178 RepID=UPI00125387DB|nr:MULTISPECIES: hypothetical protein [unclassified Bosea (in: a-proteobacteria)]CAD5254215.1 conserved hypothetical protein [Bosea sp. 7B]CAD5276857.1 conserved hypothetical protein [Bosea sp. 21B]CAD5277986.1 conserved hypothetical protein [Bosea sp. 46]VVT59833.1 conserved hypothetical protein [Bosea sp. EC-HK365B]VXB45258.1 conserved hypothetical protein [Bosea sp. 62]
MSEETLLSAARRALRFFRIDEAHGGLTSQDTLIAMDTLALQVEKESEREKRAGTDTFDHAESPSGSRT